MPFWVYLLRCADGSVYVGHTDDLERRLGEHQQGLLPGYTAQRRPVALLWSEALGTRYEAKEAERQLKGWSRAKKLALAARDWEQVRQLARSRSSAARRASTSSAPTGEKRKPQRKDIPKSVQAELVEAPRNIAQVRHLHPHLTALSPQPFDLEVTVRLDGPRMKARYRLHSPLHALVIPPRGRGERRDLLWQHTCFELFALSGDEGYAELNFAPSTDWAAYRFTGTRTGMTPLALPAPQINVTTTSDALTLTAAVTLPFAPLRLGLSAVLEARDGTRSYWALAHPDPDKPDFHHPASFVLEVPPRR